MANTIDKVVIQNDGYLYRLKYQVLSDGTPVDLTNTVMIAKSSVPTTGLAAPAALDLISVEHAMAWGLTRVELNWDATTDDEILAFGPQYDFSFGFGDFELKDPISAGNTGDILVTTKGMAANGGFFLIATFKVRAVR